MLTIKNNNIQPYLKLIGLGALEERMNPAAFIVASALADQLEQEVDNINSGEVDVWFNRYILDKKVTHRMFYTGLIALRALDVPESVKQKVNQILALIPQPQ